MLSFTILEATKLRNRQAGVEHLLLALCRAGDSFGVTYLRDLGVDYGMIFRYMEKNSMIEKGPEETQQEEEAPQIRIRAVREEAKQEEEEEQTMTEELAALEEQGAITRQGISSQLVSEFVADWILRDERLAQLELWDACCGRGGKTAGLLEKGVRVALASDPAQFRLDELKTSVHRLGLAEPKLICAPEQDVPASFPLILLDVPCSGTGTLGRAPELRLRLTPDKLNEAEKLQASILEDAWAKLQPGGVLFYATCALNRKENEKQIGKFLANHGKENGGDATLCEQRLFLPELPGHDALFLAVLSKEQEK